MIVFYITYLAVITSFCPEIFNRKIIKKRINNYLQYIFYNIGLKFKEFTINQVQKLINIVDNIVLSTMFLS